jgi:hypothetical protein
MLANTVLDGLNSDPPQLLIAILAPANRIAAAGIASDLQKKRHSLGIKDG